MGKFALDVCSVVSLAALSFSAVAGQTEDSARESCRVATSLTRLAGIREASGIAVSRRTPGVLWSVNDSGAPILYALNTSGAIIGRVRVMGAQVDDWEDVSVASCPAGSCVYIADIGDNNANRNRIAVYRVTEPEPGAPSTEIAERFSASYPEGPQDAEALFVAPQGRLFIVTKGSTGPISLYRFPADIQAGTSVVLERVSALPIAGAASHDAPRVTDAEASPDGQWVAIRTHHAVLFYRTSDLISGSPRESFRADVRVLREPQGEGVAIASNGDVYLVGESKSVGTFARLACTFPR